MKTQKQRAEYISKFIFETLRRRYPLSNREYIVTGVTAAWVLDGISKPEKFSITVVTAPFQTIFDSMDFSDESAAVLYDAGGFEVDGIQITRLERVVSSVLIGSTKVTPPKDLYHTVNRKRFLALSAKGLE